MSDILSSESDTSSIQLLPKVFEFLFSSENSKNFKGYKISISISLKYPMLEYELTHICSLDLSIVVRQRSF